MQRKNAERQCSELSKNENILSKKIPFHLTNPEVDKETIYELYVI